MKKNSYKTIGCGEAFLKEFLKFWDRVDNRQEIMGPINKAVKKYKYFFVIFIYLSFFGIIRSFFSRFVYLIFVYLTLVCLTLNKDEKTRRGGKNILSKKRYNIEKRRESNNTR